MTRRNHNGIDVANKTVLITGANRGIGRALVNEAIRRGAKRVFAGSRGPIDIADDRVTTLTLDVTNASQIQRAVEAVDTLDVLINNAGVAIYDDLSNLDVVEQHLQVNFLGMLRVTRAFVPLLKRSQGAIVNNLSLAALAALPVVVSPHPAPRARRPVGAAGVGEPRRRDVQIDVVRRRFDRLGPERARRKYGARTAERARPHE